MFADDMWVYGRGDFARHLADRLRRLEAERGRYIDFFYSKHLWGEVYADGIEAEAELAVRELLRDSE